MRRTTNPNSNGNIYGLDEAQTSMLQFYQAHTAPELAGAFEDDFWSRLVVQFSVREDCVRSMVFALSSLHRHQSNMDHHSVFVDQAVSHYAQALRSLNHHIMSSGGGRLDVTLLCSILCVVFEGLQNNLEAALVHLRSGLNLLHQWSDPGPNCSNSAVLRTSYSSPSGHLIRSTLAPFYTRLLTQIQTVVQDHGLTLPPVEHPEGDEHNVFPPFTRLVEARDTLFEHFAEGFSLRPSPADLPLTRRRQQLCSSASAKLATSRRRRYRRRPPRELLHHWSIRLEELLLQQPHLRSSHGGLVLQIWKLAVRILIRNREKQTDQASGEREGKGEEVLEEEEEEQEQERRIQEGGEEEEENIGSAQQFSEIIELVRRVHATTDSSFRADISTVVVLYFVGRQCPHAHLRRQAIDLLLESPRKEGFWDSIETARILQQQEEEEEAAEQNTTNDEEEEHEYTPTGLFGSPSRPDNVNIVIR